MRGYRAVVLAVLVAVLSAWGVESIYSDQKQNFVEVAYLPRGLAGKLHLSGYDTDHDGRQELLMTDQGGSVRIFEHVGNNQYEMVWSITGGTRLFWAAGDIDADGLTDLVIQTRFSQDSLEVFESPAPDSHPGNCVWRWEVPFLGNRARTWITDLDQDGNKEMLVIHMQRFIYVFENIADNAYTQVFKDSVWTPYGPISGSCNGDFDLDGKSEFATSDAYGNVIVYENTAVGVDSFAITWTGNVPTRTAYAVAAGNDMDQDGKPEFVIGGCHSSGGGRKQVFTVFETIGDDDYQSVWTDSSLTAGGLDLNRVTCGDVDGDSVDEMLFGVDERGIYLYKCIGPDSYERIWEWHSPYGIGALLIYDLNENGYGELVVSTPGGTWIFEKDSVGVQEMPDARGPTQEARLFQNSPNPFGAGGTNISFTVDRVPCTVSLKVYDVRGRLVRTLLDEPSNHPTIQLSNQVVWDGRDSSGRRVPTGVYFYRLSVCPALAPEGPRIEASGLGVIKATAKMVVLR